VDVLFTFAAPGGAPAARAVGAMTRALVVPADSAREMLGVRFRPGAARAVFGVPAAALTDLRVPMDLFWPGLDALREALAAPALGGAGLADRLRALDDALLRRVAAAPPPPRDLRAAVALVVDAGGRLPVDDVARALGVTRQHLARRFAAHVGLTPKTFCRVVRARAVVDRLARAPGGAVRWSALALDAGYYDPSHLIDDFRELAGLTPERWLAERTAGPRGA
jgi:AraC-like DNA-binding protein